MAFGKKRTAIYVWIEPCFTVHLWGVNIKAEGGNAAALSAPTRLM
jgi:hypothetical protein